jgi:hypothetical protein
MIVAAPMPFIEAVDAAQARTLLPTSGRTRELRKLDADIRRHALWSATVEAVAPLQRLAESLDGMIAGQVGQAEARLEMKRLWDSLGYRQPDPALAGGLQDLRSTTRINLQLETQLDMARGAGFYEQGMQPDVLDEFPALELIDTDAGNREARRDWAARWAKVGGQFFGPRMIALKTDEIWERLGTEFPDGLGNPYAPFAIGSKWRTRDVDRDEAITLGLIDASTVLFPQPMNFGRHLDNTPEVREQWLRDAIQESGRGTFDSAGVLHFPGEEPAP